MTRGKRKQAEARGDDLEGLRHHEHGPLAVHVGQLSRVPGEEEEREDAHPADQRELARGVGLRGRMDGQHRHDDLEQVVVEGAEELSPQERLQASVLERVAVAVRSHALLLAATIRAARQDVLSEP